MGIIIKQSIKGSIWSYAGVAIGFITVAYLFPRHLSADTIGLFSILLSYSILFSQFSGLGFQGITNRLFPYFRNNENHHNGFLFIALIVMITGFLLFLIFFFSIKPILIESNQEKSRLFTEYIVLLIPLTLFTLLFFQLDLYNKVLYNAVFGIYLQEFLQRVLIFFITLLFIKGILNLHGLIVAYTISVCSKGIFMFIYLAVKGEINFKPQIHFLDRKLRKEMFNVALFSILAGLGSNIVFHIDKIIINQILGLGETGVYSIAFFFGTLVIIPSRPLLRISGTLIADAFKQDNISLIGDIYGKSCLNQFIIGAFFFGGIWINIDNILVILGEEYINAKWVIFFIGLGYLIDMLTGANVQIIAYSKYFRFSLYFIFVLIIQVVVFLIIFVPIWGIVGGAIAISFSFMINNLMRFSFLYRKYKFQPFSYRFLIIAVALILSYFIGYILPKQVLVWDILFRSVVFTIVFAAIILGFKISSDVNGMVYKLLKQFSDFLKK